MRNLKKKGLAFSAIYRQVGENAAIHVRLVEQTAFKQADKIF